MMNNQDMKNLIKMREEALDCRQKAEEEILEKMFNKEKLSPKSYNVKKIQLEKWVEREKLEINMYRRDIQKGFCSTNETIKRTQRDINYMRKMFSKFGILDSKTITSAQFKYFNLWDRKAISNKSYEASISQRASNSEYES